jgi:hypothetical protein
MKKKLFIVDILKVTDEKRRLVKSTDPRIQIHIRICTKMSWDPK